MSEEEKFLARWSRRKRKAAALPSGDPAKEASASGDVGPRYAEVVEATPLPAVAGTGSVAAPPPAIDPTTLPPIESIEAGTDIGVFLQDGVPAELRRAALRRAWVADPAIRDFVGLAENAWDFNAPTGVPGFAPSIEADDVRRLAAQLLGGSPDPGTREQLATDPGSKAAAPEQEASRIFGSPEEVSEPVLAADQDQRRHSAEIVAAQKEEQPNPDRSPPIRPRHGGALPE